jgi:hypothetical protein
MGTRRIRRAARDGRCEFTLHAIEEMDEDGLTEADVTAVLLKGKLGARLAKDRRGVRFVVCGRVSGVDRLVEVVCRFLPSGVLRIITAYRLED